MNASVSEQGYSMSYRPITLYEAFTIKLTESN